LLLQAIKIFNSSIKNRKAEEKKEEDNLVIWVEQY